MVQLNAGLQLIPSYKLITTCHLLSWSQASICDIMFHPGLRTEVYFRGYAKLDMFTGKKLESDVSRHARRYAVGIGNSNGGWPWGWPWVTCLLTITDTVFYITRVPVWGARLGCPHRKIIIRSKDIYSTKCTQTNRLNKKKIYSVTPYPKKLH